MSHSSGKSTTVAIIGAGMSGICMAVKLQDAGIESYTIFEQASEVGGTWRDNTYPGLTCDVPSRYYTYSFAFVRAQPGLVAPDITWCQVRQRSDLGGLPRREMVAHQRCRRRALRRSGHRDGRRSSTSSVPRPDSVIAPAGFGDDVERARKAVSGRIRDAIGRIAADNAELGAHLQQTVTTGRYCRYL